eukprot:TRINITY_DN2972_c0_g1_i1.p1 TRINITY_DN2972_c0_g1~~TRINITY_DN2972_c0_g1_i1.p1  ORF type:complete len:420 (-),score=92.20 TRINITY_DN2972_c0_g1_i1:619-1878(-)
MDTYADIVFVKKGILTLDKVMQRIVQGEFHYRDLLRGILIEIKQPIMDIDPTQSQLLFSNMDVIYQFSCQICDSFSDPVDLMSVCESYETYVPFLKCYGDYCVNYAKHKKGISDIRKQNKAIGLCISEGERVLQQSFNSLLMYPINRISEYPSLFEKLLYSIKEDDEEFEKIQIVYQKSKDIATQIEKERVHADNLQTLLFYREKIIDNEGEIFTEHRKFLRSANVKKSSAKIGKIVKVSEALERHCILFSDAIIYCKISPKEKYQFKGQLNFEDVEVLNGSDHPAHETTIRIDSLEKGKTYWFHFETPEEKNFWFKELSEHKEMQRSGKTSGITILANGTETIKENEGIFGGNFEEMDTEELLRTCKAMDEAVQKQTQRYKTKKKYLEDQIYSKTQELERKLKLIEQLKEEEMSLMNI